MEERFNNKLDDFIAQVSNLIRQNIGTDGKVDSSASVGCPGNYILPDDAAKQTTLWKAEKAKQHSFGGDKTKRSYSKHLKPAPTQSDKWSRSSLSDAEERRLAVQNLLPGGRHGSTGSTLFKALPGTASAQRNWPALPTNTTPGAAAWGTQHHGRHSWHQDNGQVS